MGEADEGDVEIEIRSDGMSEEGVLPEAPIAERNAHASSAGADRVAVAVGARSERDRPVV